MLPQFTAAVLPMTLEIRPKRVPSPKPLATYPVVGYWQFPDGTAEAVVAYEGAVLRSARDVIAYLSVDGQEFTGRLRQASGATA
jgi:hypothetical protein